MPDEHGHESELEKIPSVRNYLLWSAVSAGAGASLGGSLEHYSGSNLGSILLCAGMGALSGFAVFCSTEYTIQKNRYDAARERDER